MIHIIRAKDSGKKEKFFGIHITHKEPRENSEKIQKPSLPGVQAFHDSEVFFQRSYPFKPAKKTVGFSPGFKCRGCGLYNKHGFMMGYCFYHKKIVDANHCCEHNTRKTYENVNMPR